MTQASRGGRRNPALLQPDGAAGPEIDLQEEHREDLEEPGQEPDETALYLLDEGDIVTTSKTVAVTLLDSPKESYFGAKITTRVREGEDALVAAQRARHVALVSILEDVEETEGQLIRIREEEEARIRAATGIQGGQQ